MVVLGIDAGHGGDNHGCRVGSIFEKDYNLGLAHCLAESLYGSGLDVEMIRWDDETVTLEERGRRSKEAGCDFVLCLHVNSLLAPSVHGFEAYHLPGNVLTAVTAHHLKDQARGWYSKSRIYRVTDLPDDPTDDWFERPENVLRAHDCDAVLAEVGYASNPDDLAFLESDWGMQTVVSLLRGAVFCYFSRAAG